MKKKFSTHWLSSKQKRKQRKYRFNAPLHIKHKFLNAHLSKELRKKYGKRNISLRKGDEVLVMRGSFKKKKTKVTLVDHKKSRVALENIQRNKKDGAKVNVYFHPSNLQIITLNLDDKKRNEALNRKAAKTPTGNKTEDNEIPSNLVIQQSGISNKHSRTKGSTINGNVYKEKKNASDKIRSK